MTKRTSTKIQDTSITNIFLQTIKHSQTLYYPTNAQYVIYNM